MKKAKEFMDEFLTKLNDGYFDKLEEQQQEWLVDFVYKLYHKDMIQIKIPLDMYECGTYYEGEVKQIKADSWVYLLQDEGGVTLYDDTMKYYCELDYSVDPKEIFYK